MGFPPIVPPLSETTIGFISCPISQEIMRDPVCSPNGDTYERSEIVKWINSKHTCPITRKPLHAKDLVPNKSLKNTIDSYIQSGRLPPFPPPKEETIVQSRWTQVGPTSRSAFANVTTVRLQGNVRLPYNVRLPTIGSSYNAGPLAPVDIPPNPNFDFIPDVSTRLMVSTAYRAVQAMDEWDFIRRYDPDANSGYVSDRNERINAIHSRVDQEYRNGHSGSSMGATMRIIQFIAKNGLNAFVQTYQ